MYLESIHACKVEDTKTEPFVIVKLAHIVRASPSHHLRIMNIFQNAHLMNTLCVHLFPRDGPYYKKLCKHKNFPLGREMSKYDCLSLICAHVRHVRGGGGDMLMEFSLCLKFSYKIVSKELFKTFWIRSIAR